MTAIVIDGGTQADRQEYISKLLGPKLELIHLSIEKSFITIKQIHDLNDSLAITPRLPRLVWIEEANLLTLPAQNALLKTLEEPPANTKFYLTCQSKSSLLPTILSRTIHIVITENQIVVDPKILSDLKQIMALTSGDRVASIVKHDRGETIVWISQIETALKGKLHEPNISAPSAAILAKIAKLAQNAHTELLANCSVGLVTQNFYLRLPHTHSVA